MVELLPSKQRAWVRFPSPAPYNIDDVMAEEVDAGGVDKQVQLEAGKEFRCRKCSWGLLCRVQLPTHIRIIIGKAEVLRMTQANAEDREVLVISDDHGNETEYEVVATFEIEGKAYVVVAPFDDEESDEGFVFRFEEEGDELILYTIEDEEEFRLVEETFNQIVEEYSSEE
jgi:uncharacterized protein YrzB (UPF0473 family)